MVRLALCCVTALMLASCASAHLNSVQGEYGPTKPSKSSAGYVLSNRKMAVTIDETTGCATLALLDQKASVERVMPTFGSASDSSPTAGYVESRDEETWQFIGQSKDGKIGWRVVYCLYFDQLNVSYIVQNKTESPMMGCVQLHGSRPTSIHPFNEEHSFDALVRDGVIRSDEHTLKPGERMSFTTRWTLP